MEVELPQKEYLTKNGYGCAVMLQRVTPEGTPGEIIGAAVVSLERRMKKGRRPASARMLNIAPGEEWSGKP